MQEGKSKEIFPDHQRNSSPESFDSISEDAGPEMKKMKLLSVVGNLQKHPMQWQRGALHQAKLNSNQLVYGFLKIV